MRRKAEICYSLPAGDLACRGGFQLPWKRSPRRTEQAGAVSHCPSQPKPGNAPVGGESWVPTPGIPPRTRGLLEDAVWDTWKANSSHHPTHSLLSPHLKSSRLQAHGTG
ncbi:hypothetical protein H1C71_029834 [Ictidomys tridecemlineatus]|nr:hypothetical protein H1C71_029834 [Ictidomys tridecemlineatus]